MKLIKNLLFFCGLLVVLTLMSAPISAQYLPQNTSPFYLYSICCENGYSSELCLYTTNDNDASFDGHDYIKYMVSVDTEDDKHATLYDFYFRQEEEKVFRYDSATKTEHLVFDFGLRKGQEFKDMHGTRFVVLQVTDTTIVQQWDDKNMGTFKKIKLQGLDDESITDEWLQGLGSLKTGLLSFEDLKGVSLYDRYYSLTLKINRINTLIEAQTASYHVFLNVNTDMLKTAFLKPKDSIADNSAFIKEGHSLGYEFVGNSLHVVGKPNILGNNYIYLMCNVQGDKVRLNYIPVQYGPGIWGFREFGIDIYFPGFSPGTYYISYIGNLVNESWDEEVEVICQATNPYPADVNSDNTIDISDIVAVINVIAGTDSNDKADVNSDGKTDISDIVAIINIIANPLTEEQTPVFELHKTLNAGMLTPLCLPVDCSTENFDEVFSIMSIDEEGNAWICPTESIPAGTPFVARCNSKREVTPFYDVSVCDKPQQTELPWAGGTVNGDFGSFSWTYTTVLDSVKTPDILTYHECDLTDMTFNVSLENLDVRRYLAQIHYDYSTVSIIEDFTFNTTMRRDIPNPVTILLPENDASELLLSIGTTEGGNDAGVFKPQAGESAYKVYNLIPQRTYYYSLAGDGHQLAKGQFRTTGQLRMIHAPSVSNIRDLGGWPTDDGRHVRYGKLLRGGELNGQHQATPEDVDVLKSLGVAAEIDLRWTRKSSERFKDISAFGFSAEEGNYFFADAEDYAGKQFGETDTQERLRKELQLVINTLKKQKAVYFHCVWGADRTGFLAFLIEGILGLTPDSFFKDFELTSFSDAGIRTKNGFADRPRFFDQFDGETLSERCIHYCTDILGISQQDIDFLKETMLE